MNKYKLVTLNEKTPTAMARVFKFGRYRLLRELYRMNILSIHIPFVSTISKALFTAVRCTVKFGFLCLFIKKAKNNNKNLALLTTYNQSHETQCILRAIDSIKELFLVNPEGERLVPVPMQDIGCEVGLHGGKWGVVGEYI